MSIGESAANVYAQEGTAENAGKGRQGHQQGGRDGVLLLPQIKSIALADRDGVRFSVDRGSMPDFFAPDLIEINLAHDRAWEENGRNPGELQETGQAT
jgi:hypothetical protein